MREHPSAGRIEVLDVQKSYVRRDGTRVLAVDDATLVVEPGEFLVLLGPSGCGKTTLLRTIAGLEPVQSGRINVHGTPVVDSGRALFVPPERRHVSMMFQSYALWPHKSVFDNVAYPLVARCVGKTERTARVEQLLDAVGIAQLARQFPSQISGGQQQRVALARALVADDGIVLFDEPLSNVDAKVREHLRTEILRLHADLGFTAVYVTHDQEEALMLASRLVVLREGRIAQDAAPQEVYEHPADSYVARFMGATNEMPAVLRDAASGPVAVSDVLGDVQGRVRPDTDAGRPVTVFSRPERWSVSADRPDSEVNVWPGVVAEVSFRGFYEDLVVAVDSEQVRVRRTGTAQHVAGDRVWLHLDPAFVHMVDEGPR